MPKKPIDKPVWNVYMEDYEGKTIRTINVFNHFSFTEDCKRVYRKYRKPEDINKLEEEIKSLAKYYFWSKCEYEIIITRWPQPKEDQNFKPIKRDVYDQIELNWNIFFKHFTEHKAFFLRRLKTLSKE